MARINFKGRIVVVAFIALILAFAITRFLINKSGTTRLKLPVGNITPAICLGERHGLILASDGSLWSWGSDFLGWPVLGLGGLANRSTELRRIGTDTNWVNISSSAAHCMAIKSDGTLWAWGENIHGQFGVGTGGRSNIMARSPVPAAPGNDWKQVAAGGAFTIALKTNGTLWAWGNNWAGPLGIGSTNNSFFPLQVGSATNWIKVWAGLLETVAMQTDGSLWYWGENPNPNFAQGAGQIITPMRISPDTDWVDVGFGVNTVLAIKSDGTLWAWGRHAHELTGASDQTQDATPTRVGTNSDWRTITASAGWWCKGLTRKDGSLWFMDASEGHPNGPQSPYPQIQFRRVEWNKDCVAYAAGATHAAAAGVHGPIGVILTRDGEVWTWGMVLGDPPTLRSRTQILAAKFTNAFHVKIPGADPDPDTDPIYRDKPWQLRNIKPR